MGDYSNYSKAQLERMRTDNNRALRDPYEQNKWIERDENKKIEAELRKR